MATTLTFSWTYLESENGNFLTTPKVVAEGKSCPIKRKWKLPVQTEVLLKIESNSGNF